MSSRLFKHQMATNSRKMISSQLVTVSGHVYNVDPSTDSFTKTTSLTNAANSSIGCFVAKRKLLILANGNGRYPNCYLRTATGFTFVAGNTIFPSTLASNANSVAASEDGKYVVVAGYDNSEIKWYSVTDSGIFVELTAPPLITGVSALNGLAISPDGKYIARALINAPYLAIYKRNENNTLTRLTNFSGLPAAGNPQTIVFVDNNVFVYPGATTSVFTIDPVTDNVVKTTPASITTLDTFCVAVSMDRKHVIFGSTRSWDYVGYYKYENGAFTKLPNPDVTLPGYANAMAFSQDGKYVAVLPTSAPYLTMYRRVGDTLVKIPATSGLTSYQMGMLFTPPVAV